MNDVQDITVTILREIRDEIRQTNVRLDQTNARLDSMGESLGARIDTTNARLDKVEEVLVELAFQQRFTGRYLKKLSARDSRFDRDLDDLRSRVEKRVERIEKHLGLEPHRR